MNCFLKNCFLVIVVFLYIVVGVVGAETVPGVVVDYSDNPTEYIASPSIVILPNGDYIASHDQYPGIMETYIYRSQDKGVTWEHLYTLPTQYESTLFVLNDVLYLIGGYISGTNNYVAVCKSVDGGETWTASTSGLITPPSPLTYHCAPTPVLIHNGRIWRAIEQPDSGYYRALVLSAPVDSNLLDSANWTISNSLLLSDYPDHWGKTWLEGNMVATPNGGG